ncbi:sugar ABC transporter permease [Streptomyces sp. F001]|uniref:sugar ABC transporter permease n=1 Tax=Streptomyces sp. F001 TaxID=1510026 RepID=UPI00101E3596|nr:sugar ABC transporter permease [Streptomyces sp. F001]
MTSHEAASSRPGCTCAVPSSFTENRTGLSSAMAVLMLTIVAVVSSLALRILKRREVDL